MSPEPVTEAPLEVRLDAGRTARVSIQRSSRARVPRLQAREGRAPTIVLPLTTSRDEALRIVTSRSGWLADKLARLEARELASRDALSGVWLDGRQIEVRRVVTEGRAVARLRDGVLVVQGPEDTHGAAIRRWYRRHARMQLRAVLAAEAERLEVEPRKVLIGSQRTRWGSCSTSGTVSLNWRLVLAPQDVQRYLAVHELCHLRVPDHRRAFWRMLDRALPDWQGSASWLERHGRALLQYSPE